MFSALFIKKFIYFFTTSTILFYLISFNSEGETALSGTQASSTKSGSKFESALQCQETVRGMNSGRPTTLRKDMQVNMLNLTHLTSPEQKVLNRYLHDFELSFADGTKPISYEVSTYIFESSARRSLGTKVVIHEPGHPEKNMGTYFLSQDGRILFSHLGGLVPTQKWDCEKSAEQPRQVASGDMVNWMVK